MKVNTILMSPPCQPFTRVGNKKDVDDARTNALLGICNILGELITINYILMENVKGFETSQSRDLFIDSLTAAGFHFQEFILSPTQIGVPNMRYRYYCLARRTEPFLFKTDRILDNLPGEATNPLAPCVSKIIEKDADLTEFLLGDDVLEKRALVLDIVYPDSVKTMCFTKAYTHYAEGTGSVYCPYDKQTLVDTFMGVKDLPISSTDRTDALRKLHLRYFTPLEVSRLMSFPQEFSFPEQTTKRQRYRLLGNSINVALVARLIKILYE